MNDKVKLLWPFASIRYCFQHKIWGIGCIFMTQVGKLSLFSLTERLNPFNYQEVAKSIKLAVCMT